MIGNIRDHRSRPYRWKRIDAVIESTEHDNCVKDADQAEPTAPENRVICEWRSGLSLTEAIRWASDTPSLVTLFLYDDGGSGLEGNNHSGG